MLKRLIAALVCFTFSFSNFQYVQAQDFSINQLPVPGTMVSVSPAFEPALIRGLTVHKDNPFLFDFIVDPGQSKLSQDELKEESDRMIKYFFASLTLPDKDIWVNLSPYEKDRMIPQSLGVTAMGRDLLAQDYMLKQLTASLIYPQKALGKTFWAKVYSKAKEMYGTTQVPVNTFNKVWIVPQSVGIYEHNQTAFIVDGHLKVMLEEDYLSMTKHNAISVPPLFYKEGVRGSSKDINKISSQIIRTIILPEIENEVNNDKNFATLRQIFYAQALAVWFKRNLKQALLNRVYANKSTVKGIDQNNPATNEAIYHQYLRAYKKGVFNYIKEDIDPVTQETLPRKYFSGGYRIGAMPETPAMLTPQAMKSAAMSVVFSVFAASKRMAMALVKPTKVISNRNRVIEALAKKYAKSKDVTLVGRGTLSQVLATIDDPAVDPMVKLDEQLLLSEQMGSRLWGFGPKALVQVKVGSVQLFVDLKDKHNIDVLALNQGYTVYLRPDVLALPKKEQAKIIFRQVSMIVGLAPATINVLLQLADSPDKPLDENQLKQIKQEIFKALRTKRMYEAVRVSSKPPFVIIGTVALNLLAIYAMQKSGMDIATQRFVSSKIHQSFAYLLGYHLFTGSKEKVYMEEAAKYLDDSPKYVNQGGIPLISQSEIRKNLTIGIAGGVVVPLLLMMGHWSHGWGPIAGTILTVGVGTKYGFLGYRQWLRNTFKEEPPSLEKAEKRAQKFSTKTNIIPAPTALSLFMWGLYSAHLGDYKMATAAWLAASIGWFGSMFPDGAWNFTNKANEYIQAWRKARYEGKVTQEIRNVMADKKTNTIIDSKTFWWVAFWEWMMVRPDQAPAFIESMLNKIDHMPHQPYPDLMLTGIGAAIAVGLIAVNEIGSLRETRRALDTYRETAADISPSDATLIYGTTLAPASAAMRATPTAADLDLFMSRLKFGSGPLHDDQRRFMVSLIYSNDPPQLNRALEWLLNKMIEKFNFTPTSDSNNGRLIKGFVYTPYDAKAIESQLRLDLGEGSNDKKTTSAAMVNEEDKKQWQESLDKQKEATRTRNSGERRPTGSQKFSDEGKSLEGTGQEFAPPSGSQEFSNEAMISAGALALTFASGLGESKDLKKYSSETGKLAEIIKERMRRMGEESLNSIRTALQNDFNKYPAAQGLLEAFQPYNIESLSSMPETEQSNVKRLIVQLAKEIGASAAMTKAQIKNEEKIHQQWKRWADYRIGREKSVHYDYTSLEEIAKTEAKKIKKEIKWGEYYRNLVRGIEDRNFESIQAVKAAVRNIGVPGGRQLEKGDGFAIERMKTLFHFYNTGKSLSHDFIGRDQHGNRMIALFSSYDASNQARRFVPSFKSVWKQMCKELNLQQTLFLKNDMYYYGVKIPDDQDRNDFYFRVEKWLEDNDSAMTGAEEQTNVLPRINTANNLNGGIDLSQQDSALRITKDANGGVTVDVDPALIARVERDGMSEVDPVIIGMRPADIQSLFGIKALSNTP